jgi:hypothetical protein
MKPEFVAPMVLYLCSEECEPSGHIFNAGMGYYNRVAVLTGTGKKFGANDPPSIETIADSFDAIDSLDGVKEFADANAAVIDLISPSAGSEHESREGS